MARDGMGRTSSPSNTVSGTHETRLAISGVAQQISLAFTTLSMLAAITVMGRRLPLSEFGTYGLLVSLTSYLLFVQSSIATAAIKAFAEADDQPARNRAFFSAATLYLVGGLVVGGITAAAGTPLLDLFDIPGDLHHQAQLGVLALGGITAVGWPFKVFQDVLRGNQLFVAAAAAESAAFMLIAAALAGLVLASGPLWSLVATGASPPLATGLISSALVRLRRLPYGFGKTTIASASIRDFLGFSTYLSLAGIADVVIYSLDRAVLAAFRSAAAVGLYEAPLRVHNLVQQVHTTLVTPVVPVAARYVAEADDQRTRELLVRGTRYTLAVVLPLTIVAMVLAKPILEVWLGARFTTAATAMIILAGYWLVNGTTGVAGRMLVAAGRARTVAFYAGAVATVNLGLSIGLTPRLGLNGVVLGTTIAYVLGTPFLLRIALKTFPVKLVDVARQAWLPAYTTAAVVAIALIIVRMSIALDSGPKVAGAALVAVLAYWVIYYVAWLGAGERVLVKSVLRVSNWH